MNLSHGEHLRVVSDAAFKRETEDGYSLRGAVFLRCCTESQLAEGAHPEEARNVICHVLDWACKSQRHVVRSTFGAELLGATDSIDQGIIVSQMLYEVRNGSITANEARKMRYDKGYIPTALYIDAKSVFAAVTATFLKTPAEKSMLSHVQFLREFLDFKVITAIVWLDTRDMSSDGLTKGAVERTLLHELMDGSMHVRNNLEAWRPRLKGGGSLSAEPQEASSESQSAEARPGYDYADIVSSRTSFASYAPNLAQPFSPYPFLHLFCCHDLSSQACGALVMDGDSPDSHYEPTPEELWLNGGYTLDSDDEPFPLAYEVERHERADDIFFLHAS